MHTSSDHLSNCLLGLLIVQIVRTEWILSFIGNQSCEADFLVAALAWTSRASSDEVILDHVANSLNWRIARCHACLAWLSVEGGLYYLLLMGFLIYLPLKGFDFMYHNPLCS